ncbi:MAG: PD-(D/E)XK nuclease family protein [Prolixibacteraceae bacterium]|nr:PD-(D/E)XK nuclease family protein [Prolixibacteraceae bacterium]
MDKFLKEVASYLYQKYNKDLYTFTLVFPNRRAGLFFQKYLSETVNQPVFTPQIITISELVGGMSNFQVLDQGQLIIELYRVFRKVTGSNETLDDFYYWGEMMLADFNDIDKYMVDAHQLFSNVESLKEIDDGFEFLTEEQLRYLSAFWISILETNNSETKARFLNLWKNLYNIYDQYKAHLTESGFSYEGMMYRNLISDLPKLSEEKVSEKTVFIGFNALNRCELRLFDFFKNNSGAMFFWDYDDYYMNMPDHEAGMFLHSNIKQFPMPDDFSFSSDNFSKLESIDVVSIPGFSGQASYAAQWISKLDTNKGESFDKTAVVLCDESLLVPFLNVVPAGIDDFNVTMGFPVKSSPVYTLVKGLVDIDRHSRTNKDGHILFYHRNIMALLNNPLIKQLAGKFVEELNDRLIRENLVYLTPDDFTNDEFLSLVFHLPETPAECRDYLLQIISQVFAVMDEDEPLVKESLYQLYLLINRMHDALIVGGEESDVEISKRLYYQLLLRQLERVSIPFEGEPLSGMQIMGFLETRSLDFDNLILLGFNDDRIPGSSSQHSFIPYSLRRGFEMPVAEHKNAMYAYYFYRLIQRAKNVTLVYDSRTDGFSRGELSRFATQLKYEAVSIKLIERQGTFNFEPSGGDEIRIKKTATLLSRIENYLQNTNVSPSALNVYMDCSLKFYFKYIEGVKESEDVLEDIDNLVFGRIAHLALEELYKPYIEKEITADIIARLLVDKRKINSSLKTALEKEFFKKGNFNLNGRNLLVFDIIKKFVVTVLKYDKTIAPFHLMSLEKKYFNRMTVESGEKTIEIKYGGSVDRLDKTGDKIRVVDYKTGKSDNIINNLDKLFKGDRNKAAFQTMLYADAVENEIETALPVLPAVYGARAVFRKDFDPLFRFGGGNLIFQANADEFRSKLKELFENILNPEIAFSQVENPQKCTFCPYKNICNR